MKSTIRRFWPAALLALCCGLPSAFAQTVNVNIYSAGSVVSDGVYMSPYYATVKNGSTSTNTTIICDDFKDESYLNSPFSANLISFSSLSSNLGSTLWGAALGSSAYTLYQEAAWLAEGLLNVVSQNPVNTVNEAYYSFAMWAVMDPSDVLNWLKSHGDMAACQAVFGNNCTSSTQLGTNSLLYLAQHNFANGNYSNLALLTPMSGGQLCKVPGSCVAQEFFTVVSATEGGAAALYLLFAAATCFGAMYLRSPRPKTATRTA